MATKTPAPTNEPTEQPSESVQPLPMPADGGTYIRNADGSLTKVEEHAQS